jgi:hypothetical protein
VSNVNLNQPPKNIITDLLNTVSPTILHLADLDYDMPIDVFSNSNNRNTLLTVYPSNFSKHKRDFTFYYNRLPANLLTNNTDKVSVKKATNTFEFIDVINKLYNLQVQHEEIYYEELPELNKDTFTNVNIKFRPESYIWIGDFTFKVKRLPLFEEIFFNPNLDAFDIPIDFTSIFSNVDLDAFDPVLD